MEGCKASEKPGVTLLKENASLTLGTTHCRSLNQTKTYIHVDSDVSGHFTAIILIFFCSSIYFFLKKKKNPPKILVWYLNYEGQFYLLKKEKQEELQ